MKQILDYFMIDGEQPHCKQNRQFTVRALDDLGRRAVRVVTPS